MTRILVVDDDIAVRTSLSLLFKRNGYQALTAERPEEALQILFREKLDLILMDMNYSRETSGEEGLDLLTEIRKTDKIIPIILITAWGSIQLAVEGMRLGATDFINKPWHNDHLLNSVQTALSISCKTTKKDRTTTLNRERLDSLYNFEKIVGSDPALLKILETIGQISKTEASVLITGESGTGKELIAEALHLNSARSDNPFVKVNLGGISNTLFESEMFGHKKGAFTDARQDRIGRFEMADNGTIFLDEIGELDLNSQVKLLRVLQERKFELLGSSITKNVNFRLVSATNRKLEKMVENGNFREDLFYRINLIILHLPPLRERRGDIPLLVNFYLNNLRKIYERPDLSVSDQAMKWLKDLPWSGNIRELKNLVERTVLVANKELLEVEDFSRQHISTPAKKDKGSLPAVGTMTLEEMEKNMIVKALEFYSNNVSKVARSLGLSRAALYRRFEKYDIDIK